MGFCAAHLVVAWSAEHSSNDFLIYISLGRSFCFYLESTSSTQKKEGELSDSSLHSVKAMLHLLERMGCFS